MHLREREREENPARVGIPLGNLTSQLFANIYLNELDQFIKHELRVKNYLRCTDDFLIISESQEYLNNLLSPIQSFLREKLKLDLHPGKVIIRKYQQGIDFLGYVVLPHYRFLRSRTKRRIWRKLADHYRDYENGLIDEISFQSTLQSYLGVFSHANAYRLSQELKNKYWF